MISELSLTLKNTIQSKTEYSLNEGQYTVAAATLFSGLFLTFEVFDLRDRLKSYNISLEHFIIFT